MGLLDLLFGCGGHDLGRPITRSKQTYRVCLSCGREFAYCMRRMRVTSEIRREATHAPEEFPGDSDERNQPRGLLWLRVAMWRSIRRLRPIG